MDNIRKSVDDLTKTVTNFYNKNRSTVLTVLGVALALGVIYYLFFRQPNFDPTMEAFYAEMEAEAAAEAEAAEEAAIAEQNGAQDQVANEAQQGPVKHLKLFFVPWCPHCKKIMEGDQSVWSQLRRKYSGRQDVKLEEINGDDAPEKTTQYGVAGFPTIILSVGDQVRKYDGDRSLQSLEKFIESA